MIKILPSNAQDAGSIPGQGAKIPHASRSTNKIQNRSSTLTNSIKTLKMVHKKKFFLIKWKTELNASKQKKM